MDGITRFVRFQMSGWTLLLYLFLLLWPHLNWEQIFEKLSGQGSGKALLAFLAIIGPAYPISFLIHQITISLFSPHKPDGYWFGRRPGIDTNCQISSTTDFEQYGPSESIPYKWATGKHWAEIGASFMYISNWRESIPKKHISVALLELASVTKVNVDMEGCITSYEYDLQRYSEEISNRTTYYYGRLENGLIVPIASLVAYKVFLFHLDKMPFLSQYFISTTSSHYHCWLYVCGIIFCLLMCYYLPTLRKNIKALEWVMVHVAKNGNANNLSTPLDQKTSD